MHHEIADGHLARRDERRKPSEQPQRHENTRDQFDQFLKEGALGSHLENLQRHGGFKGFNQKSVSVVIQATDPRLQHSHQA